MQDHTAFALNSDDEQLALESVDVDWVMGDQTIQNPQVSGCGRYESFDCNGYHFEVDWDEIAPLGEEDEPGIPHEVVMKEMDDLIKELKVRAR